MTSGQPVRVRRIAPYPFELFRRSPAHPGNASIAGEVGLDFLLFADHMTLEPLKAGLERWFGSVFAVIGYEINDPDNKNHYLAYGLSEILPPDFARREYVRRVREEGGMGFIAHPDEKRTLFPDVPPIRGRRGTRRVSTHRDMEPFVRMARTHHPHEQILPLLHPLKYLEGPEPETMERWDRLNRTGPMAGIGGTDAHAYPYRVGPIHHLYLPLQDSFQGHTTHVLLPEPLSRDAESENRRYSCAQERKVLYYQLSLGRLPRIPFLRFRGRRRFHYGRHGPGEFGGVDRNRSASGTHRASQGRGNYRLD